MNIREVLAFSIQRNQVKDKQGFSNAPTVTLSFYISFILLIRIYSLHFSASMHSTATFDHCNMFYSTGNNLYSKKHSATMFFVKALKRRISRVLVCIAYDNYSNIIYQ